MTTPGPIRILRSTDLLDLTFGFVGLTLQSGLTGRTLVPADPAQPALLVVTFGPQHVVERTFQEGSSTQADRDLPVDSLISGRSLLVFEVGASQSIDYSVAGLLGAMSTLPMHVVDAAREPAGAATTVSVRLSIPTGGGVGHATALVRLLRGRAELGIRFDAGTVLATAEGAGATAHLPVRAAAAGLPAPQNPLADPNHPYTGIELPYRMLLSPAQDAGWEHRGVIADPAPGARVELWHTRSTGTTARAVWNRDRDGVPAEPFLTAIEPAFRSLLVELTSDFTATTASGAPYLPLPLQVANLMLSSAGGWLDSLGQWPIRPGSDNNLSLWKHNATMGRDHYVRLTFEGYLAPFGHRAILVEVTERKFDEDPRAAYLFTRWFVVVKQPVLTYPLATALPVDGGAAPRLANLQFPFTSVRIETLVTPNLKTMPSDPKTDYFFPDTDTEAPFLFKVSAVDRDGRVSEFRTPLMFVPSGLNSASAIQAAVTHYHSYDPMPVSGQLLASAPPTPPVNVSAALSGQPVSFARSVKPDDTRADVDQLVWGMAVPPGLPSLTPPTTDPSPALFLPQVRWATVVIPAAKHLAGADTVVPVRFPLSYLVNDLPAVPSPTHPNAGEVFLEVINPPAPASPVLSVDFNSNSEQSGGLAAPSLNVAGLSRLTGPIASTAAGGDPDPLATFAGGQFDPTQFFDALGAKLLGLMPLSALVKGVGLGDPLKVPNFFSETVNAVTGFLSDVGRLQNRLESAIATYPAAAQQVVDAARTLVDTIGAYLSEHLAGQAAPSTSLADVDAAFNAFTSALTNLVNALPAGTDPGVLALLNRVQQEVGTWTNAAGQVLSLRDSLQKAAAGFALPETVNGRLEWNPAIQPWSPFSGAGPVFIPNDGVQHTPAGSLSLVVDLHGSLRPDLAAGADITCTLAGFALALVPGFSGMLLRFDHIRFSVSAGRKPDVDIGFDDIEFTGALSFVNTLRQLVPIDGFSDPPGITVSSDGIMAEYGFPLPNVAIGVFSLENLRLDAYVNMPFVGRSLEVGFAFCRREAPFRLTVSLLGGGGFFGIVLTPQEVAVLEAALEFGAELAMNFGVASGSLSVMAGIYFRLDIAAHDCRLTGYFRARGEVDVLGIVSASVELYLELTYDPSDGTVFGRAQITISIHIGFWSQSVTIECEKRFIGSGSTSSAALASADAAAVAAPTFAVMMAPYQDPVTGVERNPIDEYCTAFAEMS